MAEKIKTNQASSVSNRKKSNHKNSLSRDPLISIITITYNAEDVIADTARSVAKQSFRDFEHIIIDGASSDATIAKARMAAIPRLRVLSEPDEGLYDAMNKGIELARGKYIIFLNAGDTFHSPDTLKAYAEATAVNPDIIFGDTVIVNKERQFLRPRHHSVPDILTSRSFKKGMLICHQAFMVRRTLAPHYDLQYRFSADYDWCIKCIKASRPGSRINLHQVTIDYLDDGLTEKNKLKSLTERFNIMCHHYGFLAALTAHLTFIPRAIFRKMGRK